MINRQKPDIGNVLHIMRNYYHKGETILHFHNILKIHLITQKRAIPAELMQESLFFILSFFLISILIWEDDALGCQEDNLDVEPERPVLDIPDVSADTLLHLP